MELSLKQSKAALQMWVYSAYILVYYTVMAVLLFNPLTYHFTLWRMCHRWDERTETWVEQPHLTEVYVSYWFVITLLYGSIGSIVVILIELSKYSQG